MITKQYCLTLLTDLDNGEVFHFLPQYASLHAVSTREPKFNDNTPLS